MPEEDEVFQDWETKHTYFHVLFCGWKMKDLQCNIAYFSGYLMESSHDVLIQVPNSQVIFASWKRPPWLLWSGTLTRRNLTKRCHWWRRYSWTHGSCYTPKDTHGCKAYKAKPGNPLVVRTVKTTFGHVRVLEPQTLNLNVPGAIFLRLWMSPSGKMPWRLAQVWQTICASC